MNMSDGELSRGGFTVGEDLFEGGRRLIEPRLGEQRDAIGRSLSEAQG